MDLGQMEAIAVDLDKRVTALERQKLPAAFAPQNDFFINSTTQVTQQTIDVTEIKLEEGRIYSEGGLVYYENAAGEKQPIDLKEGHLESEKEELFYVNKKKEKTKLGGGAPKASAYKAGPNELEGLVLKHVFSETKDCLVIAVVVMKQTAAPKKAVRTKVKIGTYTMTFMAGFENEVHPFELEWPLSFWVPAGEEVTITIEGGEVGSSGIKSTNFVEF